MKIAFFDSNPQDQETIQQGLAGHEVQIFSESVNTINLEDIKNVQILSAFVKSKIGSDVIQALPDLRLIATRSTGYDHIDLATAKAKGVRVAYVPGYGDNTVAEYTFALILTMTRKIYEGISRVRSSGSFSLEHLKGTDLMGKTIGIVGTGRIGREVAKLARAFGMKVICFDPHPDVLFASTIGGSYLELSELLAQSDIISLHCPYLPSTHHLLNSQNLQFIKKGAILVNTSRGAVIETDALVAVLKDGRLGGAALDVLEEEGQINEELRLLADGHPNEEQLRVLLEDHILMTMPNVYITPHNAFNTSEALRRILDTTIHNIVSFVKGEDFQEVRLL